mmetsp:Transcript_29272/g.48381  ORF Transcript_29272/g.48381 Transcript_29272/m.48381 type:complete len:491 (-) Transcript_29272:97-1569(-)
MSVTIETLLDQVEALLTESNSKSQQPPRPDLPLPDNYEDGTPQYLMTLKENGLKGRGWFARQDISAGTVLCCEKPMVMIMDWQDPIIEEEGGDVGFDDDEDIAEDEIDDEMEEDEAGLSKLNELLLLELLRAIGKDPSLWTDKLSTLFPRTDDDLEVLDSWVCTDDKVFVLYEQLMGALVTPNHTTSTPATLLTEQDVKEISKRLPLVVRYNVLSAETSPELMVHPSLTNGYANMSGTALYHLPSFFNHDCQPNASRFAIGDVLWVVANQDIEAGQEVCLSYLEHEVLCEHASTRTLMLHMDFMEPEMEGQEETEDEGPEIPVVDVDVQNELMEMPNPMERLETLDHLLQQARGDATAEEEDDMDGAPWFECDVQNLRLLKALTLDSLGRMREALGLWEESVVFCDTKLPPNDEASVVVRVQAALCAMQCGYHDKARKHAAKALATHRVIFGGGVQRFRRRYKREFQLALRPTLIGGPDDLWPLVAEEAF